MNWDPATDKSLTFTPLDDFESSMKRNLNMFLECGRKANCEPRTVLYFYCLRHLLLRSSPAIHLPVAPHNGLATQTFSHLRWLLTLKLSRRRKKRKHQSFWWKKQDLCNLSIVETFSSLQYYLDKLIFTSGQRKHTH